MNARTAGMKTRTIGARDDLGWIRCRPKTAATAKYGFESNRVSIE